MIMVMNLLIQFRYMMMTSTKVIQNPSSMSAPLLLILAMLEMAGALRRGNLLPVAMEVGLSTD
jgi:hypothetical protein